MLPIAEVKPRERNPRKHPPEQIESLAKSIREFGFTAPVLIEADGTLIAGHGRVEAAKKAGLERVPCLRVGHLTSAQVRAYVIADNRLGLDATWDESMLASELHELGAEGFDLGLTGFSSEEFSELVASINGEKEPQYTAKIKGLAYEITGAKPTIDQMVDSKKASNLKAEIEASNLPHEVKDFLSLAANRHVVFNYGQIAEYYAHAPKDVQLLMEKSALVIVDMDSAIQNGYVEMTKTIEEIQRLAKNEK